MRTNPLRTELVLPCGVTLGNRIAKAAMTERMCGSDHLPGPKHINLYDHWAGNGAGLLITGNIMVDRRYLESTGNVVIEKKTDPSPFETWASAVKRRGVHLWAQLSHAGRQSNIFSTLHPVSASDVKLNKMGSFARPKPLTEKGIENVIERFAFAAEFCQKTGFTGIQFHAAHGYLISQFLSPITNRRTDRWGGSLENRARLLLEIVRKTRGIVGKHFPISVKINSADFQRGGFDENDSRIVIKMLEGLGIDLLEISGGTYEKSAMMGIGVKESTRKREAYFMEFAADVRKHVKMPLMVTGGFRTRKGCIDAILKDKIDMIGMARPFLLDENFPKGFLNGTQDTVPVPQVKILDPTYADMAEAGFYDFQIKRLATGKKLKFNYSSISNALHIPLIEMKMGLRNRLFS